MKELIKTDITVGANIEDVYVAMCITSDDNSLTKLRIAPETARIVARNLLAQVEEIEADQAEAAPNTAKKDNGPNVRQNGKGEKVWQA